MWMLGKWGVDFIGFEWGIKGWVEMGRGGWRGMWGAGVSGF
jgi:hypothetical protein